MRLNFVVAVVICTVLPGISAGADIVDAYGRPLADPLGPIRYLVDGEQWLALRADGARVPASPIVEAMARADAAPSTTNTSSAYHLGAYAATDPGSWPEAVAIGDVTADGRPDVVLTTTYDFDPNNDYHVFVYPQQADGTLAAPTSYPYNATAARNGLVLVHLNEDGVLDVVVGHDSGLSVLLADSAGGLGAATVTTGLPANTLAAMDVNLDTHTDIISLSWSMGAEIFLGDGSGGFSGVEGLDTNANGYNDHEVEDLDNDGFADLAVMSGQSSTNLSVHLHDGVGVLSTDPDTYSMGGDNSAGVGLGDVSGDGLHDVVLSRPYNSPTWLWVMSQSPSGTLTGPTTLDSYDGPESVEVADLDHNGLEDIVVVHGGWLRVGVYMQERAGMTEEARYPIPYASHYAPQGLAVGDFSSDGCADVAIADYNQGLVTLLGQGCLGFSDGFESGDTSAWSATVP